VQVDDNIPAWDMAWFRGIGSRFFLAPLWVRIAVTTTSVAVNADVGERDANGRLIRYQSGDGATARLEAFVVDEAEAIRWAYEISADADRPAHAR